MSETTPTTTTAPAARFSLRVPPSWITFDPTRAYRSGEITRLVDERIEQLPQLRPQRADLVAGLRKVCEEAQQAGAVMSAAAIDDHGEDGVLLASLVVFRTDGMPVDGLNTVDAIAAQLTVTPRRPVAAGKDRAQEPDWREVRIVDLPAGRAVRAQGVTSLSETPVTFGDVTGIPRVVSMQTIVPIPGGDDLLDVTLSSPQVWLPDEFLDLFEAITETLTWQEAPALR